MLIHIVLGKERENLDADEQRELAATMDSLGTVPGVLSMTWGRDISGRGKGYTCAAVTHFSGRDGLQDYQVHERHKRAVDIFNRLMPDRLVVDYET